MECLESASSPSVEADQLEKAAHDAVSSTTSTVLFLKGDPK
jgi:hypothetical protein